MVSRCVFHWKFIVRRKWRKSFLAYYLFFFLNFKFSIFKITGPSHSQGHLHFISSIPGPYSLHCKSKQRRQTISLINLVACYSWELRALLRLGGICAETCRLLLFFTELSHKIFPWESFVSIYWAWESCASRSVFSARWFFGYFSSCK